MRSFAHWCLAHLAHWPACSKATSSSSPSATATIEPTASAGTNQIAVGGVPISLTGAVSDDGKPVVSAQLMRTALEYARTHLDRPLNVEELADVVHLSPRQFTRVFTAETGQSPAKAVESLRLEAARVMIEQSRHSLDRVAKETGFRDRRHMREVFMRGFGVPPQAVRRS